MIGGHLASAAAVRLGWPTTFVQSLVVAGVAAGISSTFLAQLAAVVFAFEVVLGGLGGIAFVVPTLIAVGIAGLVTYELVGTPATYPVPLDVVHWDLTLAVYLAAAVVAGIAAIAYVDLLGRLRPLWAKVPLAPMARMVVAAAVVGLVAIWLPQVMGTGTATMKDLFGGATIPLATLVTLAVVETIAHADRPRRRLRGWRDRAVDADRVDARGRDGDRRDGHLPRRPVLPGGLCDDRDRRDVGRQLPRADLRGPHDLRDGR